MSEGLQQFANALKGAGADFAFTALLLIAVGLPVALAAYVLLRRVATKHGVDISFKWTLGDKADETSPFESRPSRRDANLAAPERPASRIGDPAATPQAPAWLKALDSVQRFLETLHTVMVTFGAIALAVGAFFAFRHATPGNGLALVGGILSLLALIVFLSADKQDRQRREAQAWGDALGSLLRNVKVSTVHAPSQVFRLDQHRLDAARRMINDGASLEDICRAVEPDFPAWDAWKQDAFRRMLEAALE